MNDGKQNYLTQEPEKKIRFLFLNGLKVWLHPFAARITSVVSMAKAIISKKKPQSNKMGNISTVEK